MSTYEQPAEFTARWKASSNMVLRAICGKPGCPGALGRFQRFTFDWLDPTALEKSLHALETFQTEIENLEWKNQAKVEFDELLQRCKANLQAYVDSMRHAAQNWSDIRDRSMDTWVMMPDDAINRKLAPIYYGYPDSGFRISYKGKRTKKGLRISRRPFPAVSGFEEHLRNHRLVSEWSAPGQAPSPPCKIWCPVCDSLNLVPLPEGFETIDTPSQQTNPLLN